MTQFEKIFNLMRNPWAILVYVVLVILAYNFVDMPLAFYFHELDFRTNLHVFKFLTTFGKSIIYVALFVLAGLYFRYVGKNSAYEQKSWFLLACIIIPNLVVLIIKIILGRARPDLLFSSNLFGFYWLKFSGPYWSMPSGHTTTVISLASGLGIIFPKYFYAYLLLALFVVLSRVLLYYHYLSDVMTAFYLCILIVGIFAQYIKQAGYLNKAWKKQ